MAHCWELILLVPLGVLAVGDLRSRTVSVVWLTVLAVLTVGGSIAADGVWTALANMALNLLVVLYLAAGVALWVRIRQRAWTNPLREWVGAGDVALLLAITPLFEPRGYVLMLIGACVFSLAWVAAARGARVAMHTVPFAATTAIALGGVVLFKWLMINYE